MTNNQIEPEQNPNELSDDELNSVSGGGIFSDAVDAAKNLASDVLETGKEVVSDVGKAIEILSQPK